MKFFTVGLQPQAGERHAELLLSRKPYEVSDMILLQANRSKIKALKEFEGKCEPTFLFYKVD